MAAEIVRCECGEALGEACAWEGPIEETVIVEWMPEHLRASHIAARNMGSYPANGAIRIRVHRECAEYVTHEPDEEHPDLLGEPSPWSRIVEGA